MKDKVLILASFFLIITVFVCLTLYLVDYQALLTTANFSNNRANGEQELGEIGLFEEYIKENIAALSPEPAVLGGSFYVTEINVLNNGIALVNYEDGHIALKAIIGFKITNEQVIVESIKIISEESTDKLIN